MDLSEEKRNFHKLLGFDVRRANFSADSIERLATAAKRPVREARTPRAKTPAMRPVVNIPQWNRFHSPPHQWMIANFSGFNRRLPEAESTWMM